MDLAIDVYKSGIPSGTLRIGMVVPKIGSVAQICMVAWEDRIIDLPRLRQQSPNLPCLYSL